ncbi:hypothetical protein HNR21_000326 [Actinomadura cellulosilytica]|uniref:Uncharacterized protein n=1 Tax=Thermomonospora cellulosilytica TaxID=1411118 RepID=A0A7W3MT75_9ACTN|nr:hypothetical protein [Thermomonospora cellulosilytica]
MMRGFRVGRRVAGQLSRVRPDTARPDPEFRKALRERLMADAAGAARIPARRRRSGRWPWSG